MSQAEVDSWMRDGERRQRRWGLIGAIAGGAAVVTIAIVAAALECNAIPADDKRAIEAVEASGFSQVVLGHADPLACADGELSRHFGATNPSGKTVTGTVCCGVAAKGCTLRWGR